MVEPIGPGLGRVTGDEDDLTMEGSYSEADARRLRKLASALDVLPENTDEISAEELKHTLLEVRERVVLLIYTLMHDYLPTGAVYALIGQLAGREAKYPAEELEALARRYANVLFGDEIEAVPKATRDWIETFPERIRQDGHFMDVLKEIEGKRPLDEKTKAAVTAEVIVRQRRDRDEGK